MGYTVKVTVSRYSPIATPELEADPAGYLSRDHRREAQRLLLLLRQALERPED